MIASERAARTGPTSRLRSRAPTPGHDLSDRQLQRGNSVLRHRADNIALGQDADETTINIKDNQHAN